MHKPSIDPVLGCVPSGVYILTVGTGDRATGMLASWIMQAGFEPPTISIAVNSERYVCDWLSQGQPFVVNVIGDHQKQLLRHFGRGFAEGDPAFEDLAISHCPRGVPILDDSVGHMECEPTGHTDSGDHRVFLARVVRGSHSTERRPMVHIRKSGAHY